MKKNFYWNALIKNMGKRNFIGLILSIILVIIGMILVFNEFGIELVIESFALSYLFDNLREFKNAIKMTNDEFTIKE